MKLHFDKTDLKWRDAHEILAGGITPRPIAWVSTLGPDGVASVAPFSFCGPLIVQPMIVGFNVSSRRTGRDKRTLVNIRFTRDFVWNVVTEALAEQMNICCKNYPSNVSKFKEAGVTPAKSDVVKSPMVAESPINLECRLVQILEFGEAPEIYGEFAGGPRTSHLVLGEVLKAHIEKDVYDASSKEIIAAKLRAIGRLGGYDLYSRAVDGFFELRRPEDYPEVLLR